jgi:hypothetical protein
LAVIVGVQELRVEIFSLREPQAEAVIHFPIHATARGEIEIIAGAEWSESCAE